MKNQPVNPVDAAWLLMESADTPMHVGLLAIFRKPRNAPADYLSKASEKMRAFGDLAPPWNCRYSGGAGPTVLPRWVEVQDLDLDYHFRHSALPAPGGERELGVMVSRLHSYALDRTRPLWEFHLIEGLERNRFAFYVKIHHALVGDVNTVPWLLSLLSSNPRRRNMPPFWVVPGNSGVGEAVDMDAEALLAEIRERLPVSVESIVSLGKSALGLLRTAVTPKKSSSFLLPAGAPRSTLNRFINPQRRFATQQFELSRIEALAAATDSAFNDILAYLCGTSLRRFFKEYNALPDDSLVAVVPVSWQKRGGGKQGKAMTGLRITLGTDKGDPLARLRAIKESTRAARRDMQSLPEVAASSYALMRSVPILASQMPLVGRLVPPLFNLGVSMTPGSDVPLYYNGARLEALYPMSQLMQHGALSIDSVSYAGTLNIGFTGARDTLPHLQRLAVYAGQALADLEEIVKAEEGEK